MTTPSSPRRPAKPLPQTDEVLPTAPGPDARTRPDERKEGGPDFGGADHQRAKRDRDAADARRSDPPGVERPPEG